MSIKVYDCFPFLNEIDLLHVRLNELEGLVDRFIIVESIKTFAGRDKILYYEKYKEEFKKFHDKITYIVVNDMPVEHLMKTDGNLRNTSSIKYTMELNNVDKMILFT